MDPSGVAGQTFGIVTSQREIINNVGSEYRGHLLAALNALSRITVDQVNAPSDPNTPALADLTFDLEDPKMRELVLGTLRDIPVFKGVDSLLNKLDIGSMPNLPAPPESPLLAIPEAPALVYPDKPQRPDIDTDITFPDAPSSALPELRALHEIKLPDDPVIELPDFSALPPQPDFSVPGEVTLEWKEPEYKSELYDELVAKVREWLQGGTGLPPYIEDALFNRTRARDHAETKRVVQEAFDTWSSRGFTMPPGMLVAAVDAAKEEGRFKAAETNREILIEAAKWEIENIRFAVQQGIALEELSINLFQNMVQRLFEAAKFHAQSRIDLLNIHVAVFNAKAQAYGMVVEAFKARLQLAMSKLEVWKGRLEGLGLVSQLNNQYLEEFKARVGAVGQAVEIFKAMMEGARIRTEVQRGQIEMYRTDVQAYGEELGAEKVKFDAFKSRVDGELAKSNIHEANARAYAATIQGLTAEVDAKAKAAAIAADAARIMLAAYEAEITGVDTHNKAMITKLQAEADVLKTFIAAWEAKSRSNIAEAEVQSKWIDMGIRSHLAIAETRIKRYEVQQSKAVQEAQVALSAASAMGQYSAQLAAGAMSAVNIGASVSSGASVNDTRTKSETTTTSHNYNYG